MAELVVEGHAHGTETSTTEPGAVQGFLTGRKRRGIGYDVRERVGEGRDSFEG